jgi:putative oxidoreductase
MLDRPARPEFTHSSFGADATDGRPRSALDRIAAGVGGEALWLLARLLIGGIFVQSGSAKLLGLGAFAAGLSKAGVPMAGELAVIGALVEFCGGLAIVAGLKTRHAALLMFAFVIVATTISHRFWELPEPAAHQQAVHFAKNLAIMGGFLLLFVAGGGRFSADRWLQGEGSAPSRSAPERDDVIPASRRSA